jgi:hypothetical protein
MPLSSSLRDSSCGRAAFLRKRRTKALFSAGPIDGLSAKIDATCSHTCVRRTSAEYALPSGGGACHDTNLPLHSPMPTSASQAPPFIQPPNSPFPYTLASPATSCGMPLR